MLWSDVSRFGGFRDPWRELDKMQRVFQDFSSPRSGEFPAMNVWTSGDEAIVTAELPGIDPKSVDISVVGKAVTVRGARQPEAIMGDEAHHRQERWSGQFSRSIELPFAVDAGKVEARFSKGILKITLPRTEADKPRKITVLSE